MNNKGVVVVVLISGCSSKEKPSLQSSADWAIGFVVWNSNVYEFLVEDVTPKEIGEQIGEVKQ